MTDFRRGPKAELHCHLLGVISPDLLAFVQSTGSAVLVDPPDLARLYPVRGLAGFQRYIEALRPYQSSSHAAMLPIFAAHVDRLIQDEVVYAELMISPAMFPLATAPLIDAFEQWRERCTAIEQGRIQVEFLMVVPRSLDETSLERDTSNFIALRERDLIAGVALVGPENGGSLRSFERSFARWRDAGLGIEVHAGEHSGPECVWDAIRYARPDRIGHGISAFRDAALLDQIVANNIHVEFCLTSNVCTEAVSGIENHPVRLARDLGISFSLNTDDPGAFQCSMATEFETAGETFGFTATDASAILAHTLSARFAATSRVSIVTTIGIHH